MFDFVTFHLFDRLWGSLLFSWRVDATSSKFGSLIDPNGQEANTEGAGDPGGSPLEFGSFIDPNG